MSVKLDFIDLKTQYAALKAPIAERRAELQAALQAQGIPTAVHYPRPVHHQAAYASHCCPDCCPRSIAASEHVLSLPMSADLSLADQQRVVAAIAGALPMHR